MTTATLSQPKTTADETYRDPKTLEWVGLAYRFMADKSRPHVVVVEWATDHPGVHNHDTIEAARETWKRLRARVIARGYTERIAR